MDLERQKRDDLDRLKEACRSLIEHFDTVQIFGTRHEGSRDATIEALWGQGNWHARYGQVRQWVIEMEHQIRLDVEERRDEPD